MSLFGSRAPSPPQPSPKPVCRPLWHDPTGQRGFPAPLNPSERRSPPFGHVPGFGGVWFKQTRQWDRGAGAYAPNFGTVFENPIGAGVVALNRPRAWYGPAGQYAAGAIFWAPQTIPTSIGLTGLTSPDVMAALLGTVNVQAAIRTTG